MKTHSFSVLPRATGPRGGEQSHPQTPRRNRLFLAPLGLGRATLQVRPGANAAWSSRAAPRRHFRAPFLPWWTAGALLLAGTALHAQHYFPYWPGTNALEISFGCNCCCTTNTLTNSPVGMFLATNPVTGVSGNSALAAQTSGGIAQSVPPHWALSPLGPDGDFEGWTTTEPVATSISGTFTWP